MKERNRLLILYHLNYFIYGLQFTTIAPLIPYLAENSIQKQSDFIFLISIRGGMYIFGGLAEKFLYHNIRAHIKLSISLFVLAVTFFLASLTFDPTYWAILGVFFSLAACEIQILGLTMVLRLSSAKDKAFWSSSIYVVHNIGGIIGPALISYFSMQQLKIVGFFALACCLGFIYQMVKHQNYQSKCYQSQLAEHINPEINENISNKGMPIAVKYYYFGVFLCYASFTMSYRLLIPSYAVMTGTMTKQQAAVIISFFYCFLTGVLIVSMHIQVNIVKQLRMINITSIVIALICIIGHYANQIYLIIIISAIGYGIIFSAFYPLLFAVPTVFGIQVTQQDVALFVIAFNIGQSVICAMIGQGMILFTPQFLLLAMFAASFVLKYCCDNSVRIMREITKKSKQEQIQIAQLRYSLAKSITSNYD